MENFAKAGLKVEDIDYVLCTHLHVDHVGWNTRLDNGRWVPTFPNAKYVFSKTDRDYFDPARGEGGKIEAHARVFNDSVLPILEAKQDMVVDGIHKLGDDITISPAPGHSPGHVLITLHVEGHRGAVHRRHHAQPDPDLSPALEQRLLLRPRAGAARRGGACWSMRRPRAAWSIRSHFAGPHYRARRRDGRAGSRICRGAAEAACWACAAISAARPRLCAPWTASAALGRGCNTYRLS